MTDQGLMRGREGDAPRAVTLSYDAQEMVLTDARGQSDWVAMSALRIRREEGGTLVLGRRGRRRWSLHLGGSAARNVRALLPPVEPRFTRLRRWAFRNPKLAGIALAAPTFMADHLPGRWLAPMTPPALAERLDQGAVTAIRRTHCSWPQGQHALDTLVHRLDPDVAQHVSIVAVPDPSFLVTAIPGNRIVVFNSALTEAEPEVLAALVAHELAHIRHRDVVRAIGRGEGRDYVWRLITGPDAPKLANVEYSAAEERAADADAIRLLRAAHIALLPAAAFFDRIDKADAARPLLCAGLQYASPRRARTSVGLGPRSRRRDADPVERDLLDGLFNLCAFSRVGQRNSPI